MSLLVISKFLLQMSLTGRAMCLTMGRSLDPYIAKSSGDGKWHMEDDTYTEVS